MYCTPERYGTYSQYGTRTVRGIATLLSRFTCHETARLSTRAPVNSQSRNNTQNKTTVLRTDSTCTDCTGTYCTIHLLSISTLVDDGTMEMEGEGYAKHPSSLLLYLVAISYIGLAHYEYSASINRSGAREDGRPQQSATSNSNTKRKEEGSITLRNE
jgi:hypothetical protein